MSININSLKRWVKKNTPKLIRDKINKVVVEDTRYGLITILVLRKGKKLTSKQKIDLAVTFERLREELYNKYKLHIRDTDFKKVGNIPNTDYIALQFTRRRPPTVKIKVDVKEKKKKKKKKKPLSPKRLRVAIKKAKSFDDILRITKNLN